MREDIVSLARKTGVADAALRPLSHPPAVSGDFAADAAAFGALWTALDEVRRRLADTPGAKREDLLAIRDFGAETREAFLGAHVEALYGRLTDDHRRFPRAEQLVIDAGDVMPGLVPTRAALKEEQGRRLADKHGLELPQGLLLSHVLASPKAGMHLCHAMLLPRAESAAALETFRREGRVDLGRARVERRGDAAVVVMSQPERLNCEDDTTVPVVETAVDVALLDPQARICVLRGDVVSHPKYAGRRLFGSGINLTGLYWGQVSYQFYIGHDLGFINKMFRGIARPDRDPSEVGGGTREKLWIAALEGFAIGGACQYLLVMDHIIAERGAYMTLPARKEGIIPGMANLRLPRFVGHRLARQAIMNDRRIDCDSPEGRMICDEIVARDDMDAAIDRSVARLTGSGVVSAAGNRRALRMHAEPLDRFRQYAAVYAREQAYCHLSPALIANLERHWQAHERAAE